MPVLMYDRDQNLKRPDANHRALTTLLGGSIEVQKVVRPGPFPGEFDARTLLEQGGAGYDRVILHALGAEASDLVQTAVLGFMVAERSLGDFIYLIPQGGDNHPDLLGTDAHVVRVRPDGYFGRTSAQDIYDLLKRG